MPIHVKELVIKANVGNGGDTGGQAQRGSQDATQTEVIKAAVAEVMRIIKDKKNR
ncbi:MAG TPA: DUF5908 family protein [Bacteroidia bacterium]|nr:DUF5908 family protein [Bacteroidia bacterium]